MRNSRNGKGNDESIHAFGIRMVYVECGVHEESAILTSLDDRCSFHSIAFWLCVQKSALGCGRLVGSKTLQTTLISSFMSR